MNILGQIYKLKIIIKTINKCYESDYHHHHYNYYYYISLLI